MDEILYKGRRNRKAESSTVNVCPKSFDISLFLTEQLRSQCGIIKNIASETKNNSGRNKHKSKKYLNEIGKVKHLNTLDTKNMALYLCMFLDLTDTCYIPYFTYIYIAIICLRTHNMRVSPFYSIMHN